MFILSLHMLRSSDTLGETNFTYSQDQHEQNSGKIIPHLYVHLHSLAVSAWMSSAQISLFMLCLGCMLSFNVLPCLKLVKKFVVVGGGGGGWWWGCVSLF